MTSRIVNPIENNYLTDKAGNLLPGGTLEFYAAGTSDALAVYSDSALTTSLGSTLTADSNGLLPDFHMAAGTEYKCIGKNSSGATQWTRDEIFSADSSLDARIDALESTVSSLSQLAKNTLGNGGMRVTTATGAQDLSTSYQVAPNVCQPDQRHIDAGRVHRLCERPLSALFLGDDFRRC